MREVDVVVGVIFRGRRFLVEKRKKSEKIDPGIVNLPGGHVESGESRRAALVREMKEELNIQVKRTRFVQKRRWNASNGEKEHVHYFLILDIVGSLSGKRGKESCGWRIWRSLTLKSTNARLKKAGRSCRKNR